MKIHFIYFDIYTGYQPSLHHGLAYLAGTLRSFGHKVSLSHLIDRQGLINLGRTLACGNFDIIALSFTTNQKRYARLFLDNAQVQDSFIVAGGSHPSLTKEKIFDEFPELQGICIGEGEIPFKTLCEKMKLKEYYLNTPSFYFNTKEGIVKNQCILFEEIESLSLPDYSIFNYKKFITENGLTFPMMLSRGCPFNCAHCCNHALKENYLNKEKYVRLLPPQRAINTIKHNLSLFPQTKKINFADDTFTLNKKWIVEFCKLYKKEVSLPFICNARVETINRDILKSLKVAGCIFLNFGVESGSEWLRENILNRKHKNNKIINAFQLGREMGIPCYSYNMIGIPFETEDMARETFLLNMQLRPPFGGVFYFYPYPGTRLFNLCQKNELLRKDFDSVSGYLEKPSIKESFMSHKSMNYYFEMLQVSFYMRLAFKMIKLPQMLEKPLLALAFIFRKLIIYLIDPTSKNGGVKKIRQFFRMLVMRNTR